MFAPATLSGLTASATYHYRLVATNSAGTSYGYDYTFSTLAAPPSNTVAPQISGTARQGQSLSVSLGSWSAVVNSYSFQWQRSADGGASWSDIAGASTANYVPLSADIGDAVRAKVTASNQGGSGSANAAAVGPVLSGAPVNTVPPTISGSPAQGHALSVSSTWNPTGTLSYQWQRSTDSGASWSNISAATGASYTPQKSDEGARLRVNVSVSNSFGQASASSPAVGPVIADPPLNTLAPVMTGTAQRTYVLSGTQGTWNGAGNVYSYQWQRSTDGVNWTAISGATALNYTLTQADEGALVRLLVSASNPDGIASAPSNQTTTIVSQYPPANIVAPLISGAATRSSTLNATLGSWSGPALSFSFQWQHDAGSGFVNIAGATYSTYTLQASDENTTVRVVVAAANIDGTVMEASQPTAAVKGAVPVNVDAPVISGTVQRDSTLRATTGTWNGLANSYTYQWQSSTDAKAWTDIPGATALSYTVTKGDEGSMLRLLVSASNADGTAVSQSQPTGTVPNSAPANSAAPQLTGQALRGVVVQSSQGTWTGVGNSYAYQWQRSSDNGATWTSIQGATDTSYMLGTADENTRVRVQVTASNTDGTLAVGSQPSATVLSAPPVNTAAPALTGQPARGSTLTGTQGAWSGIGNTYAWQWQHSSDGGSTWTDIAGAVGSTYPLWPSDANTMIRLRITAANADGQLTLTSAAVGPVLSAPPISTAAPTLTGSAQRGQTLTGTQGTWSGLGNTYTYRWQRSADGQTWTNITGASDSSYTITLADEQNKIRLQVIAANPDAPGGVSAISSATATVPAAPAVATVAPSISGSAQRGQTLTGAQGIWTGIGNTYAYQWQRSADNGATWTNISGATGTSYTIAFADERSILRLQVTGANLDSPSGVNALSAPTTSIPSAPPVNSAAPAITGTAARASTLTGTQGTWTGVGNTYAYQWQRNAGSGYVNIAGASASSYTLAVADENATVRMLVTASNPDGTLSVGSSPTATIPAAPPLNTALPTVSGTAKRTFALTGTQGTWAGIGNSYTYQWQRSADGNTWTNITGASDVTYTVQAAEETNLVRMQLTATNPDGTLTVASAPTARVQGGASREHATAEHQRHRADGRSR